MAATTGDFQAMVSRLKSMNSEQLISTMGKGEDRKDDDGAPIGSTVAPEDQSIDDGSNHRHGRKRKASTKAAEAAEDAAELAKEHAAQKEASKVMKQAKVTVKAGSPTKGPKLPKKDKSSPAETGKKRQRIHKSVGQPAATATLFTKPTVAVAGSQAPSLFKPAEPAASAKLEGGAEAAPTDCVQVSPALDEGAPRDGAEQVAPSVVPEPMDHMEEGQEATIPAPGGGSTSELPDHPMPDLSAFPAATAPGGVQQPPDTATAAMLLSQHLLNSAARTAPDGTPLETPVVPIVGSEGAPHVDGTPPGAAMGASDAGAQVMAGPSVSHVAHESMEASTKYTGVRRNKGGRYSARIKLGGTNKYLGSFKTAEEAARAFDECAIQNGRPVETLNFPAAYGGPTVGQAYRKRKVHKLYADPNNHINVLLQKLADVDRSNPGILRLTMGTLGVPESRYLADNKYAGIRQQASHWETRIRYKDKLYSMGFFASVEAAALAWDITAASLRRCRKLNFPEVSFADLEQQLDALKCVIAQSHPPTALPHGMIRMPPMVSPGAIVDGTPGDGTGDMDVDPGEEDEDAAGTHGLPGPAGVPLGDGQLPPGMLMPLSGGGGEGMAIPPPGSEDPQQLGDPQIPPPGAELHDMEDLEQMQAVSEGVPGMPVPTGGRVPGPHGPLDAGAYVTAQGGGDMSEAAVMGDVSGEMHVMHAADAAQGAPEQLPPTGEVPPAGELPPASEVPPAENEMHVEPEGAHAMDPEKVQSLGGDRPQTDEEAVGSTVQHEEFGREPGA